MKIAYLANSFPEALEPYVWEEIAELRRRGAYVIPCGVRKPKIPPEEITKAGDTYYVLPLKPKECLQASWTLLCRLWLIRRLLWRAIKGPESLSRRLRTLVHTFLGAYLAVQLEKSRVAHIHIHHGYFAAWVGMIAARLLGIGFSMTLHGSDMLVRADYLDAKLDECRFCFTVSEFNRRYLLQKYESVPSVKVLARRLGIDPSHWRNIGPPRKNAPFSIVSVGRLRPVKNFGFLVLACRQLKARGIPFRCTIAGEGPERRQLEGLISELDLTREVMLSGYVPRRALPALYASADVVVLTSHSEGIPVTMMEAMAMEKIVIAPKITGMAELITHGETGLLYSVGSMDDFIANLEFVARCGHLMQEMRHAARRQVESQFDAAANHAQFASEFLQRLACACEKRPLFQESNEDSVLQQI